MISDYIISAIGLLLITDDLSVYLTRNSLHSVHKAMVCFVMNGILDTMAYSTLSSSENGVQLLASSTCNKGRWMGEGLKVTVCEAGSF